MKKHYSHITTFVLLLRACKLFFSIIFYDRQQMDKDELERLRAFVEVCKTQPNVLHLPELKFYRQWLERYVMWSTKLR